MSGRAQARGRFLWLLRHGKAASDAPWGGGDRERPLTGRGRRDATALGKALGAGDGPFGVEEVLPPEVVICSAAVRTRQTADLLIESSGTGLPLVPRRSLYGADVETALQEIREVDDGARSVLVVGHNPTMYRLAYELLADEGPTRGRTGRQTLAAGEFPTCALAALAFPVGTWQEVEVGRGELRGLFTPPY